MKLAVFAYSRRGMALADDIKAHFIGEHEIRAFAPKRLSGGTFAQITLPSEELYGRLFSWADGLVFIGSCGIALRSVAPHIRDKRTDPAVLCIDELGSYVIPLLSGHIGGANRLARSIAESLGSLAVITTATDINGRFSVDSWAAARGYEIEDMDRAKLISAAILEKDLPFYCPFPVKGGYAPGILPGEEGELGIALSYRQGEAPFDTTLRLIPRVLHLGLGCRKDTPAAFFREAVEKVMQENGLDIRAIGLAATIDIKAEEPGLLEYCRQMGWQLHCYSPDILNSVPGTFTSSALVERVTGTDNVCERAAMVGAEELLVRKTAIKGVTVAVAAEKMEVRFD